MTPPSTPDKYPSKDMFDTIVDITVGEGRNTKTFKVHKGVLCFYSGYFNSALNGGFGEASRGAVDMPSEGADIFERILLWLYTRKLDDKLMEAFRPLCRLWVFADRRQIPMLMNFCIDAIKDHFVEKWAVPSADLAYIYENTTSTSGLRRMAVHIIAMTTSQEITLSNRDRWPREALWDFLQIKWDRDNTKKMWKTEAANIDTCQFHQHEEGVSCSKKRKAPDI